MALQQAPSQKAPARNGATPSDPSSNGSSGPVQPSGIPARTAVNRFDQLKRHDLWWVQPLATVVVLGLFTIYVTWRALEDNYFLSTANGAHYLSPFYSPLLPFKLSVPGLGWRISPAFYVLLFPLWFRGTCYYYRKAYYRAFFWDPPACAVGEFAKRPNYRGERWAFPQWLMGLHRYAFYFAAIVVAILWWDTFLAFDFSGHFGVSIGSLIFLVNVVLLSMYTFSCHSWRHLSGGCVNCFSCTAANKQRHTLWEKITHLNENHALWAWCSLFSVVFVDLYVRLLCTGALPASWGKPF